MLQLLQNCSRNMQNLPCCHPQPYICNCSNCCYEDFRYRPDTYNCPKKLNYYVINYGPLYASEIYYYFLYSKILENNFIGKDIKVLSLGCGFGPDLFALDRYINDSHLNISFIYEGIDLNQAWSTATYQTNNSNYTYCDLLTTPLIFSGYDIIFISKLFSTLYRNMVSNEFLNLLRNSIITQMGINSLLIFNDINSIYMGRDLFHNSVGNMFSSIRQFYFDNPKYSESNWIKIPVQRLYFQPPPGFNSLNEIRQTVIFEYRK